VLEDAESTPVSREIDHTQNGLSGIHQEVARAVQSEAETPGLFQ
jgi:gamma-glutamylcysteine synthetase